MTPPADLHEWVSFEDPEEERTWVFDVTFLTSRWHCIFGEGCTGVLTGPAPELVHGCCSYGAHFTGPEDIRATEERAAELRDDQWQFAARARDLGGPIMVDEAGDTVTHQVEEACIFLNRPGFPTGPGCALHHAAVDAGERPLDWKPDVCWQLPLRLHEETDAHGYVTSTLREWKRRDWGEGGFEFHWWCTDDTDPDAFTGDDVVYRYLREEIIELVGEVPYRMLVDHLEARRSVAGSAVFLPHPAVRARR